MQTIPTPGACLEHHHTSIRDTLSISDTRFVPIILDARAALAVLCRYLLEVCGPLPSPFDLPLFLCCIA
jgi:hypothetical protein